MKFIDSLIVMMPSIVAALYSIVGVCYVFKKDYAWATIWLAYAMANIGLILIGLRK
jgi:hypothetical protein